jgi:hypothetical protein
MWAGIQARLDQAGSQPEKEPPLPVWARLSDWGFSLPRLGFAMAACLGLVLVVVLGIKPPHLPRKDEASPKETARTTQGQAEKQSLKPGFASARKARGKKAPARDEAVVADNEAAKAGAVIPSSRHTMRPMLRASAASLGSGEKGPYLEASQEPELAPAPARRETAPLILPRSQGGVGANGLWDWTYFNQAVAARQWLEAAAELKAARKNGGPGTERSYAASMINLLSLPSQVLSSVGLPPESESWSNAEVKLVVIQAGSWQRPDNGNSARFGGDVMVRLKGFRTLGPGFTYHFSAHQAVFEPGTRFTRLANEPAVRIKDPDGKDFTGNEFTIVDNAVYDFRKDMIQLKADQGVEP